MKKWRSNSPIPLVPVNVDVFFSAICGDEDQSVFIASHRSRGPLGIPIIKPPRYGSMVSPSLVLHCFERLQTLIISAATFQTMPLTDRYKVRIVAGAVQCIRDWSISLPSTYPLPDPCAKMPKHPLATRGAQFVQKSTNHLDHLDQSDHLDPSWLAHYPIRPRRWSEV